MNPFRSTHLQCQSSAGRLECRKWFLSAPEPDCLGDTRTWHTWCLTPHLYTVLDFERHSAALASLFSKQAVCTDRKQSNKQVNLRRHLTCRRSHCRRRRDNFVASIILLGAKELVGYVGIATTLFIKLTLEVGLRQFDDVLGLTLLVKHPVTPEHVSLQVRFGCELCLGSITCKCQ